MRLIQFFIPSLGRRVGVVESGHAFDLTSIRPRWSSVYKVFMSAQRSNRPLMVHIERSNFRKEAKVIDYEKLLKLSPGDPEGWLLPPIDHPDPAHCMISGTGLTHIGSMAQRDAMHKSGTNKTDSQVMFEMGLEGGKPKHDEIGVQPEWFYKGNGTILRGHNDFLDIPPFSSECGEEPEIAACYIISRDGIPHRIGFAIGNEWSDHTMEKVNYLWLAPSKLRTCSIGPELVIGKEFVDIRGYCKIYRQGRLIYDSGELLTGENNMTHSLRNLEWHHFKYPQFRCPGDVHIHFLGTMKLSFGNCEPLKDGDKIEIHFDGMGESLVNYVKRLQHDLIPFNVSDA